MTDPALAPTDVVWVCMYRCRYCPQTKSTRAVLATHEKWCSARGAALDELLEVVSRGR